MKVIALVLFVISFEALGVMSLLSDNQKKMLSILADDCKIETHATDADVVELIQLKAPTTETGKCLLGCVQAQIGLTANNKFVPLAFVKMMEMVFPDDEKIAKMSKVIAEECASVENEDKCKLSSLIYECVMKSAKARGFELLGG